MHSLNCLIVYSIVLSKSFISMSKGIITTVHFGDFCHKMENRMFITVILLVVTSGGCVGDNKETEISPLDSGGETKGRRLLLNDPNTLLKEIEALHREMTSLKSHVTTMETEVTTQRTRILSLESQLSSRSKQGTGSIYTVWGKKACPALNDTTTVYSGITGGKPFNEVGGGVDTLCLPHDPDDAPRDFPTSIIDSAAHMYGSEYQFTYGKFAGDDDVPCAVCHVQSSGSVMMIPAKNTCPSGWNIQYHGYLVTDNDNSGWYAFDFVCLNADAEYLTEGARQHNLNGHILYPVTAVCGSLPCPPYRNGQYITCVVCTL